MPCSAGPCDPRVAPEWRGPRGPRRAVLLHYHHLLDNMEHYTLGTDGDTGDMELGKQQNI